MRILIKNGRVIDPRNGIDEILDVLTVGEKIERVAKGINADNNKADLVIDAGGKWVTPGLIDIHVHFREPGYEHKETIATGMRSAARGGFTTVCCMPNTNPVVDSKELVEFIKAKAGKEAIINVLPVGAITKEQRGTELADIGEMVAAGACAVSEDGKTVEDVGLMRQAFVESKKHNISVFAHCEDEEKIVEREITLAAETGARLHLCHLSLEGSVRRLREAKARGEAVTAEVAPHHFTLCREDIFPSGNANFKMNPPLVEKTDVEALKIALKDGIIEVIATDHAPHHADEKNVDYEQAANGVVGLETSVPLCITELVRGGWLTPFELIKKMTENPARIIGVDKGSLSEGADADITIIDPDRAYEINADSFVSMGKNTPFHGRRVYGAVEYTICGGRVVYEADTYA